MPCALIQARTSDSPNSTCRPIEGITVLAEHAPGLSTALERAAAAGYTHLNLDGTVIRTDRVAAPGPNGSDL